MKSPLDKHIAIVFHSLQTKRKEMWWRAVLHFPPGSDENTNLEITMEDGNGKSVDYAVFAFAGKRLVVKNGKTSISYADFIRGKHEKALWVYRRAMPPIPGALTFT